MFLVTSCFQKLILVQLYDKGLKKMSEIDDMSRVNSCMQEKIDMNIFNRTFINMINANRFFFSTEQT